MQVSGQRWEYQIGNTNIIFENAWSWRGYSQERVRVNDEGIKDRQGWFWLIWSKSEVATFKILDEEYAVIIGVQYTDADYNIYSRIITETEVFEPQGFIEAKWDTKAYLWPPEPDLFST